VAGLDQQDQEFWLERAEEYHWTVRELRAWLKADKPKPLPTHTLLLRFCQNLPTPVIIAQILRVYFPDAETVLDMTGGDGGFWDGSELVEVTIVVDPDGTPNDGHDFRDLEDVAAESHDVALFDPPHVADAGDESIMGTRFGTYDDVDLEDAIRASCREAWRIARLRVVVKVTDHMHGQRYVLESDWVRQQIGQAPFDEVYESGAAECRDRSEMGVAVERLQQRLNLPRLPQGRPNARPTLMDDHARLEALMARQQLHVWPRTADSQALALPSLVEIFLRSVSPGCLLWRSRSSQIRHQST
jgi:hypothetical protein